MSRLCRAAFHKVSGIGLATRQSSFCNAGCQPNATYFVKSRSWGKASALRPSFRSDRSSRFRRTANSSQYSVGRKANGARGSRPYKANL
jgi:hypothetical protein